MPLDDLQNFNSGYRTLTGDFPFRDYYNSILDIGKEIFINYLVLASNPYFIPQ